jgi:catecholate siderophore receptor
VFGGYKLSDDIEIRFNVLNITDETYYDALYRSATPFTYVAPGRSAQVTLDWHF